MDSKGQTSIGILAYGIPAIFAIGGIWFMMSDQTLKTSYGLAGPALIVFALIAAVVIAMITGRSH